MFLSFLRRRGKGNFSPPSQHVMCLDPKTSQWKGLPVTHLSSCNKFLRLFLLVKRNFQLLPYQFCWGRYKHSILEHPQSLTRITLMVSEGHLQISSDLKCDVVNCSRILLKSRKYVEYLLGSPCGHGLMYCIIFELFFRQRKSAVKLRCTLVSNHSYCNGSRWDFMSVSLLWGTSCVSVKAMRSQFF